MGLEGEHEDPVAFGVEDPKALKPTPVSKSPVRSVHAPFVAKKKSNSHQTHIIIPRFKQKHTGGLQLIDEKRPKARKRNQEELSDSSWPFKSTTVASLRAMSNEKRPITRAAVWVGQSNSTMKVVSFQSGGGVCAV